MSGQLLPHFRLLNTSLSVARFSALKPISLAEHSPRVMPAFSPIFSLKLKYGSLSRKIGISTLQVQDETLSQQFDVRQFSTRSDRHRPRSSDVTATKSLIEDEAELSDWVGALKSDSFRTRLFSSSDEDDNVRGSGRGRRESRGGRDRISSTKRRKDSDSDDYLMSNRQRGRDSFRSSRRNESDDYSMSNPQKGRDSFRLSTRNSSDDYSLSNRQKDRDSFRSSSGKSGWKSRILSESEQDDDAFSLGKRMNRPPREMNSTLSKRGARGSDRRYGKDQMINGRGELKVGGKTSFRGKFLTSDEDIGDDDYDDDGDEEGEDRLRKNFSSFIDKEDSEEGEEADSNNGDMFNNASNLFAARGEAGQQRAPSSPGRSDSYLSETRFDQCSISSLSLKGIKDAGYERMTVVQEATLPVILKGKDVLAKAKTGTGKTVAFLLPSIEAIVKSTADDHDKKRSPILVLVICPTRELATQAAAEANTLLKYHPSIGVQVVIGGTRLALEQKRMQANPCQILVATPGRLRDHIENTVGFAIRLMGVKVLVLDEADRLLDMGFRRDIENIIDAVPKPRQTLLFSATVPEQVRQVCHIALKRDHEFIDTVGQGSEETHSKVKQTHLVAPLDKHFSILYTLLKDHIADDVDYKVLVFCTTAMMTKLIADLLGELNLNVREIHSRKSQSYRTKISDEFRKSKGLILVTSDVSARGVDYPDVTLVVQVGLPADREQYIHRLGRTGRKGKEGQGILLLAPWEEFFLSSIKDLPISKGEVPLNDPEMRKKVDQALSHVEMRSKEAAYQAWLGYYNSNKIVARDKCRLVELANEFSQSMGLDKPPAIPKLVLGKMGLRNIPGLRSK